MNNERLYLGALGLVNALGRHKSEVSARLFAGDTGGLIVETGFIPNKKVCVGRVSGRLPEVPRALSDYASRNNSLLLLAFQEIEDAVTECFRRYGAARIGIVLGTSTSGIAEGSAAMTMYRKAGRWPEAYRYVQQELGTPALFLAKYLKCQGPAYTVSTACTSSAKAFAAARRLIREDLCDAVLVGGVDSLNPLTLNGFAALESLSATRCNPMSENRQGINIGEGAALFILSREPSQYALLGIGESSDAYHMSAPHPEGLGAEMAMLKALKDASLTPDEIDYLNMHATATPKNDEMESRAMARVFGSGVWTSGTKPLSGHTLGAAGATELAFCWLSLDQHRLPPHIWDGVPDPRLPALSLVPLGMRFMRTQKRVCMSNSFAFGGSNASLIIGDRRGALDGES